MGEPAGDLVPFTENPKEVRKESDRRMRAAMAHKIRSMPASDKYRKNWERIFRKK